MIFNFFKRNNQKVNAVKVIQRYFKNYKEKIDKERYFLLRTIEQSNSNFINILGVNEFSYKDVLLLHNDNYEKEIKDDYKFHMEERKRIKNNLK